MKGYVYVLSNPAHHKNLYKVGMTRRSPSTRVFELSNTTGVPQNFVCVYTLLVTDCQAAEKLAHTALNEYRVNQSREFFDIPLEQLVILLFHCCKHLVINDDLIPTKKLSEEEIIFNQVDNLLELGQKSILSSDYEIASRYFKSAMDLGSHHAGYHLAKALDEFSDISGDQYDQLLINAAENGVVDAAIELADRYHPYNTNEPDVEKVIYYYELAIRQGSAQAAHLLGCLYSVHLEETNSENDKKAFEFLGLAYELGSTEAKYDLGNCYLYGWGVEKNNQYAVALRKEARQAGFITGFERRLKERYEQDFGEPLDIISLLSGHGSHEEIEFLEFSVEYARSEMHECELIDGCEMAEMWSEKESVISTIDYADIEYMDYQPRPYIERIWAMPKCSFDFCDMDAFVAKLGGQVLQVCTRHLIEHILKSRSSLQYRLTQ